MSQKITSKNLSYDTSLPPFLAALRAQASGATGPDPLLAAHRRPGKKRSGSEEAEDIPLVVDENGNTIDLEVDKDGTVKESATEKVEDAAKDEKTDGNGKLDRSEAETKSAIGGRKRKVGNKVIGGAANETPNKDDKSDSTRKDDKEVEPSVNKKVKKKVKKIKLSFDEE